VNARAACLQRILVKDGGLRLVCLLRIDFSSAGSGPVIRVVDKGLATQPRCTPYLFLAAFREAGRAAEGLRNKGGKSAKPATASGFVVESVEFVVLAIWKTPYSRCIGRLASATRRQHGCQCSKGLSSARTSTAKERIADP
jgi:hypothetical protein